MLSEQIICGGTPSLQPKNRHHGKYKGWYLEDVLGCLGGCGLRNQHDIETSNKKHNNSSLIISFILDNNNNNNTYDVILQGKIFFSMNDSVNLAHTSMV